MRLPRIDSRDALLAYARRKRRSAEPVFCVQVGANDGRANDPVHVYFRDFGWRGLLVEPQVDVFETALKPAYAGNPNVSLENVALAATAGERDFYRLTVSTSRWATGLSGFRRDVIQAHIDNGYVARRAADEGLALPGEAAHLIEVVKVRTTTMAQLLAKYAVTRVDILCVDTEGYDFEILKLVDFDRFLPEVILFESKNLSATDKVGAYALLARYGYRLYRDRGDTLALACGYPWHRRLMGLARARWRRRLTG